MASEQYSGQNGVVAPCNADPTGARDSTHAFIDAIKATRWITTATVGLLAAGTLASCGGNESSPTVQPARRRLPACRRRAASGDHQTGGDHQAEAAADQQEAGSQATGARTPAGV